MFWTVGLLLAIDTYHWYKPGNMEINYKKNFFVDFLQYSSFFPYYFVYLNLAVLFSVQYATFGQEEYHNQRLLCIIHRYLMTEVQKGHKEEVVDQAGGAHNQASNLTAKEQNKLAYKYKRGEGKTPTIYEALGEKMALEKLTAMP